jgi:hypothetical protein
MKKLLAWLTQLCDKVIEKEIHKPTMLGRVEVSTSTEYIESKPKLPDGVSEDGVSEPIISFVQCVKDNPKRFSLLYKGGDYGHEVYEVYDRTKLIGFTFGVIRHWREDSLKFQVKLFNSFVTTQEEAYIISNLSYLYDISMKKRELLKQLQHQRQHREVRNKLKEIYKND